MSRHVFLHSFFLIALLLICIHHSLSAPPVEGNLPQHPKEGTIKTTYCEYYNQSLPERCEGNDTNSTDCVREIFKEECPSTEPDKFSYCFVIWQYNMNGKSISLGKGCFIDTVARNKRASSCQRPYSNIHVVYCCCQGDMCNENMTFPGIEALTTEPPSKVVTATIRPAAEDDKTALIITLTPLFILFVVLII